MDSSGRGERGEVARVTYRRDLPPLGPGAEHEAREYILDALARWQRETADEILAVLLATCAPVESSAAPAGEPPPAARAPEPGAPGGPRDIAYDPEPFLLASSLCRRSRQACCRSLFSMIPLAL